MNKNIKLFFTLLLFVKLSLIKTQSKNNVGPKADSCTLTQKGSQDPFPSLSKCYKYNNEACCLSVHDDYINNYIAEILSESCIRKYSEFENLMCFGCHPLESKYIYFNNTEQKNKIRICKSFALRLWDNSEEPNENALDGPTTVFDNCGFKVENEILQEVFNESTYLIPSRDFKNFTHFFSLIRIPFYEDYEIEIQTETNEDCYNHSSNINKVQLLYLLFIVFSFLI